MPEIAGKYAYGGPLASRGLAGWGNLLWVFPSGLCHAVGETPQSDDHLAFLNVPPDQRRAVNIEREHTEWEPLRRASLPPVGICLTVASHRLAPWTSTARPRNLNSPSDPLGSEIGLWSKQRGSRNRSKAFCDRIMPSSKCPCEKNGSTGSIRGVPSRRIVATMASPVRSRRSAPSRATSGAAVSNSLQITCVASASHPKDTAWPTA